MPQTAVKPKPVTRVKPQRPPLYKVILLNDDFTPREFVVLVLKAVFQMHEDIAHRVMLTAHQKGACVIAVYTRDIAETKAKEATEMGRSQGYPLFLRHRARGINANPSVRHRFGLSAPEILGHSPAARGARQGSRAAARWIVWRIIHRVI